MVLVIYVIWSKCDYRILVTGNSIFMKLCIREHIVTTSQHRRMELLYDVCGAFAEYGHIVSYTNSFSFPLFSFTHLQPKPRSKPKAYAVSTDAFGCKDVPFWGSHGKCFHFGGARD